MSSSPVKRERDLSPDLDPNLEPQGTSFPSSENDLPDSVQPFNLGSGAVRVGVLQQDWAARLSGRGLALMGPRGPCWPLPSLSSWQMKEPKQSSLALSNAPGTPRPDPPTDSLRGQKAGQPPAGPGDPGPFLLPKTQRGGRLVQGSSSRDPTRQGASVARGGGCPAIVAKDIPLREPPPPLPLPPAVPGPRQRKTKTRAEETAAVAPPEKPGQKARASRPRCPAAGVLALPPLSVPPALPAPRVPAPCLPSSFPPP